MSHTWESMTLLQDASLRGQASIWSSTRGLGGGTQNYLDILMPLFPIGRQGCDCVGRTVRGVGKLAS